MVLPCSSASAEKIRSVDAACGCNAISLLMSAWSRGRAWVNFKDPPQSSGEAEIEG